MSGVDRIVVIYNPRSTRRSRDLAVRFQRRAHRRLRIPVHVRTTEYPSHAAEIACEFAEADGGTMIVSCSGDGGFHEVINGILTSRAPGTVLGLLPGGNANDLYGYMHHGDVFRRISVGRAEHIDVLRVESSAGWVQYVHSYAGVGMTSQINDVLSKHDFNPLREAGLVLKHLFEIRPVRVFVRGQHKHLDSLLFLNSGRMSKVVKTTGDVSISDGRFELFEIGAGNPSDLLLHFLKSMTIGLDEAKHVKRYSFTCEHDMSMQLDGERMQLKAGERLTITCETKRLRCII